MSGDIRETGGQERTQRSSRGSRWNSIPNSTNSDLRRGREDLLQPLRRERDEAQRKLFDDGRVIFRVRFLNPTHPILIDDSLTARQRKRLAV